MTGIVLRLWMRVHPTRLLPFYVQSGYVASDRNVRNAFFLHTRFAVEFMGPLELSNYNILISIDIR